ncbi:hypothetical protein X801_06589, partial [Opisthorchis viverrini]
PQSLILGRSDECRRPHSYTSHTRLISALCGSPGFRFAVNQSLSLFKQLTWSKPILVSELLALIHQMYFNVAESTEHSWMSPYTSKNRDLYFTDGKRSIDYVLVYSRTKTTEVHAAKRTAFLKGLARELVEIEVEDCCGQILGKTDVGSSPPTEPIISASIQPTLAAIPVCPEPNPQQKRTRKESTRGQPSSMDRYRFRAEHEESALLDLSDLVFVKLHAPWKTMERYAEMFNFRKPLKMQDPENVKMHPKPSCSDCCEFDKSVLKPLRNTFTWPFQKQRLYLFDIPENQNEFFTAVERAMVLDYILRRTPCVFEDNPELGKQTCCDVVHPPQLDEATSSNNSPGFNGRRRPAELDVGITKMLSDGVFSAAYPLHEHTAAIENYTRLLDTVAPTEQVAQKLVGHIIPKTLLHHTYSPISFVWLFCTWDRSQFGLLKRTLTHCGIAEPHLTITAGLRRRLIGKLIPCRVFSPFPCELSKSGESFNCVNNRILLKRYWASYKSFGRPQPFDYIRHYFGEAIAFYFAWLGFYTLCLVPVAILGVLIFLFGLIGMFNDPIVKDVCEYGSSIIMCPLCDHVRCQFWRLNSSCLRSKLTRLVDNEGTVLFGVIMALWGKFILLVNRGCVPFLVFHSQFDAVWEHNEDQVENGSTDAPHVNQMALLKPLQGSLELVRNCVCVDYTLCSVQF